MTDATLLTIEATIAGSFLGGMLSYGVAWIFDRKQRETTAMTFQLMADLFRDKVMEHYRAHGNVPDWYLRPLWFMQHKKCLHCGRRIKEVGNARFAYRDDMDIPDEDYLLDILGVCCQECHKERYDLDEKIKKLKANMDRPR